MYILVCFYTNTCFPDMVQEGCDPVLEITVGHQTFCIYLNIFGFDQTKCLSRKLFRSIYVLQIHVNNPVGCYCPNKSQMSDQNHFCSDNVS